MPVVLESPVGGVHYWASDRRPLLVDCRLGLALHRIGPVLRQHGIEKVRFSGAYVNRTTRRGRPSLHARGLAVDIHDWVVGSDTITVKQHYARGAGCGDEAPLLNRLACSLSATGLFRELLTPDYDRDHHDHFHLAVRPEAAPPAALARQSAARGDER